MFKQLCVQIFKDSRDKFQRKILKKEIVRPWMKYREIEIIEEIFQNLKPQHVLEWGTGFSTLYFSNFFSQYQQWVSIEHNKEWAEKIRTMNKSSRVEIVYVEPNDVVLTDKNKEGLYSNFKDYIEFPSNLNKMDLILIDGRARNDCLKKARKIIKKEGVVILHDANRAHYQEFFNLFEHQFLFKDYRSGEGGIWIGSIKFDIQEILDLNRHRNLWKIYNKTKIF